MPEHHLATQSEELKIHIYSNLKNQNKTEITLEELKSSKKVVLMQHLGAVRFLESTGGS